MKYCVATIGNFDGVHLGHQALIQSTLCLAQEQDVRAKVFTFKPHPIQVLCPSIPFFPLCREEEKIQYIEAVRPVSRVSPVSPVSCVNSACTAKQDAPNVHFLLFEQGLAAKSAKDFCLFLQEKEQVNAIYLGYDFRMGSDQSNVHAITEIGKEIGMSVYIQKAIIEPDTKGIISSTLIRHALKNGDIVLANRMLSREHSVQGEVVHGFARGKKLLGTATANMAAPVELIPKNGTYASTCKILSGVFAGKEFASVTNVGTNPTFEGQKQSIETHLLNFDADIYTEHIQVKFLTFLREEQRFSSLDALKEQIKKDISIRQKLESKHE